MTPGLHHPPVSMTLHKMCGSVGSVKLSALLIRDFIDDHFQQCVDQRLLCLSPAIDNFPMLNIK